MRVLKYFIIFLVLNFSALAAGSWLMDSGAQSIWYSNLNKAPWTPPGWAFGVAWTTIMICFSIYMAFLYKLANGLKLRTLFFIQLVLNISWNFLFFNQHLISLALIDIFLLTTVIGTFLFKYKTILGYTSLLILPYFIWLCIATSLNAYILIYN
ncbi:tryptophan-rich sensory protein [Oceanihabitans sp. IOP_32]|uniref:TspO/MBR family protein n=1 Tax=Oceanihabitans sp. IOP_32 TaxID=2529032 RepID=UPI001293E96D|nr:TspO/MBR family protein [Oceanihabitans sp. IOP_32]QFZ53642.1 tryptophan-rich sensory protein [Oceanihabitans sp. IOP_32]